MTKTLRVAQVGYAFMGGAHSFAWRNVVPQFGLDVDVQRAVLIGRTQGNLEAAAHQLGWAETATDWHEVIERDDIDIVDICSPGGSHAEIAIAALEAGKHVLCEKPLANSSVEADRMAEVAAEASKRGIRSMVGHSYRRAPAVSLMKRMYDEGAVGTLRHIRGLYLQDWIVDPEFPLVWRLRAADAGTGSLGDIGSHVIDMAQFVTGQNLVGFSALSETFVKDRPLPGAYSGLSAGAVSDERGTVDVDDATIILSRTDAGALATFEATRFATGRKNFIQLELNGSNGSLLFNFENMNELLYCEHTGSAEDGFRRIEATDASHPYLEAWWPPGHGLGYENCFVNQARDFVVSILEGTDPEPSFAVGAHLQHQLEAIVASAAANATWTPVS